MIPSMGVAGTNVMSSCKSPIIAELATLTKKLKNPLYAVKGIQCHSNRSPQLFELKKKQQNQVTLFKIFFVLFVVVTHNTFTQLNIPTQDLPSWFV